MPQAIRPQFSRFDAPTAAQSKAELKKQSLFQVPEKIATALAAANVACPPPVSLAYHNPKEAEKKLPKGLTFRKVCSHCGRQRAEHGELGFGKGVTKCPFTTCGRCGADEERHKAAFSGSYDDDGNPMPVPMGVGCTLTEKDGAGPGMSEKYDAMLADLASRAEIVAAIEISGVSASAVKKMRSR